MSISIPGADYTPQLTGYTGQGAFRFWCQKVLPLVYDDSLSYYELLNKIVVYLNNVITDVATVEDNVGLLHSSYELLQKFVNDTNENIETELNNFEYSITQSFETLQGFVNNYFDNLDVQDEINNKLDVMASDGTLNALITPLITAQAPDIIADWLSNHITPTSPAVDSTLTVSGAAADAKIVGERLIDRTMLNTSVVEDYFIDTRTGSRTSNQTFNYWDFKVIPGDTLVYYAGRADSNIGLCFYDDEGVFLSGVESTATPLQIVVPENAVTAKATFRKAIVDSYVRSIYNINTLINYIFTEDARLNNDISKNEKLLIKRTMLDDSVVEDYFIDTRTGARTSNPTFNYWEFGVAPGDILIYLAGRADSNIGMCFYDRFGNFISGVESTIDATSVTVPDEAYTAKATYRKSVTTAYVRSVNNINSVLNLIYDVANDEIKRYVADSKIVNGSFIDTRTGAITANTTFSYYEFAVIGGDTIVYKAGRDETDIGACFYDVNGSFISGVDASVDSVEITVPENAVLCRATFRPTITTHYVMTADNINTIIQAIARCNNELSNVVNRTLNDYNTVTGYFIDIRTGARTANVNFEYKEFKVLPGDTIYYKAGRYDENIGICFYDYAGNFISGNQSQLYGVDCEVPVNAVIAKATNRIALASNAEIRIVKNIGTFVNFTHEYKRNNSFCGLNMFDSIGFVGDSYTQGGMKLTADSGWIAAKNPFPKVIQKETGTTCVNFGVGGATAKSYIENNINAVLSSNPCDVYFIDFGVNDANQGLTIGTTSDLHADYTENPDTFIGNLGRIVGMIKNNFPVCRVVIGGCWHWRSSVNYDEYLEAARVTARALNVPFIDPFDDSFFNTDVYRKTMISGHPNQVTYTGMGHAVIRLMEDCILHNVEYFNGAGLSNN